jgi:hypothetical protein
LPGNLIFYCNHVDNFAQESNQDFMTLCWWFYFEIGLSICDLILQFMLMILLGSSVWGFYDFVAHFGWWFCLSHVWGFFMILLRNLCWWLHLSWVQGFYDLFAQFMLMNFLELDLFQDFMILLYVHLRWWFFLNLARILWSCCMIYVDDFAWDNCEDFVILMHNLCWWFCLSQVQGLYDLVAQFMLMTLPQSCEDFKILLYSLCWWSFAWVSWGYYDLVVYNWCWWFCFNLALEFYDLVVCEFILMMFVAQGSFQGQLQKFLRRQMLIGNLSIMSPCLISRSTWSRWHLIPYQLDFKPESDFMMSIDFNLEFSTKFLGTSSDWTREAEFAWL